MLHRGVSARWKLGGLSALFTLVIAMVVLNASPVKAAQQEPYNWQSVSIGGGGFVSGMVMHPTEPDLAYIRTDVGGAYRWDPVNHKWIQLMNKIPRRQSNLYGIDSIAIDPSDPNVVYVAAGKYDWSNGDILKSTDRGATWTSSGFNLRMLANGTGKDQGERLVVDPNNGQILFMGTRYDGLWKSTTGASNGSWQKVTSFPAVGTAPHGVSFVVFDKSTGTAGQATQTIYAGAKGQGVYRSLDGGATWTLMAGSPTNFVRAVVASNGTLYVSCDDGVVKFAGGAWTTITPPTAGRYVGISVDPTNPNIVMTAVQSGTNFPAPIYRSTNGGTSWSQISFIKHPDVPWWTGNWFAAAIASLTIDPVHPNRVWFTDFFGTWRTDDITANPSHWYTYEQGHEEVVTFALRSTPIGAPLLSGHADVDGMRHTSLNTFPSSKFGNPYMGDTVSIDFEESNPNFVARVGSTRYQNSGGGAYSTDNGANWTAFPNPPGIAGRIAVSAASETMVWVPMYGSPLYSTDRGQTWKASTGAPANTVPDFWIWWQPLASDRVNNNTFYLLERASGNFYRSTDGGATWSTASTLPASTANLAFFSVKAAPGMAGEVWAGLSANGLWRSSNSGTTWAQIPNVQEAKLFAFGKNKLGSPNPTVFVYGKVDNTEGIFRSDDLGATWVRIDMPDVAVGDEANTMEGDRQVWGRVYIGTNGTGVYYGESLMSEGTDTQPPTAPANLASPSQTSTTVNLTWTASTDNTGVAGYNIYNGSAYLGTTTSPSSTSYTVTGLTPSTAYAFTVKAKDGAGNLSPASNTVNVSTKAPPAAPTNLVATQTTLTSIGLSWTPPSNMAGVTGYKIFVSGKEVGVATGTTYTMSGLLPDRTYSVTVSSVDAAGSPSAPSNTLAAATSAGPGTSSFSDNFEDGVADGWTTQNGTWAIATAGGSKVYRQSSWLATPAFSTVDNSAYGNYSVETTVKLTMSDVDLGAGIVARYQDPNNRYSFQIRAGRLQIAKVVNGTNTVLAQKNFNMATNSTYTFTAVLNNSALDFYVDGFKELSATDSALTTGKVGVYAFKTTADFDNVKVVRDRDYTPPSPPANLKASSKSETSIDLAWDASADNIGVMEYQVYQGANLLASVTSATYSVAGLTPNTAYTFSVRAKDAAGNVSTASAPFSVSTDAYLVQANKTLTAISVDGALDESVWSMAKQLKKPIIGTPNNSAEFGVLWDNTYLYVGVKVLDGKLYNTAQLPYYDDSVEIYIDSNNNKGATYDSHDQQYVKGWNDSALWLQKMMVSGTQHGWAPIAGGYSVELAIPWSSLGLTPAAGLTVGFDVANNDTDTGTGRESQLMWAGTNDNWSNTSAFGSLTLSANVTGDTQAPTAPTNLTSPSHTDRTVQLSWNASTDNVGVTGYDVYKGSSLVASVASTTYTITGLTPSTAYNFTVKAKDAANNVSSASNSVSVTTDASYTLLNVSKTNAAMTIDGNLNESAWSIAKPVTKDASGTSNNTTKFGVLWDDTYLYVGVSVADANLFNNSADPYADDSVEIYIDGNHNKGTTYDSYDRQFIKGWNDSTLWEQKAKTTGVQHAWAATTGGYTVELAIPWSSLGVTPTVGMTIGFDVANNDEDDGNGRQIQTVWAGESTNWTDTSAFGDLTLAAQ